MDQTHKSNSPGMCDSLFGPLSKSAQPSKVWSPILSASFDTESWAVSHGWTSMAFVLPSKKKNRQTIVPRRFIACNIRVFIRAMSHLCNKTTYGNFYRRWRKFSWSRLSSVWVIHTPLNILKAFTGGIQVCLKKADEVLQRNFLLIINQWWFWL